jgi:hypothetical protein
MEMELSSMPAVARSQLQARLRNFRSEYDKFKADMVSRYYWWRFGAHAVRRRRHQPGRRRVMNCWAMHLAIMIQRPWISVRDCWPEQIACRTPVGD